MLKLKSFFNKIVNFKLNSSTKTTIIMALSIIIPFLLLTLCMNCIFMNHPEGFTNKKSNTKTINEGFFVDVKDILGLGGNADVISSNTDPSNQQRELELEALKHVDPRKVSANNFNNLPANISTNVDVDDYVSPVNGKELNDKMLGVQPNEDEKKTIEASKRIVTKDGVPINIEGQQSAPQSAPPSCSQKPPSNKMEKPIEPSKAPIPEPEPKPSNDSIFKEGSCMFVSSLDGLSDDYVKMGASFGLVGSMENIGLMCQGDGQFKKSQAIAIIENKQIKDVRILDMGLGYDDDVTVSVEGNAQLKARTDDKGQVVAIEVINGGSGYTETPDIMISGSANSTKTCHLVCRK
jgi:hypothetical protein